MKVKFILDNLSEEDISHIKSKSVINENLKTLFDKMIYLSDETLLPKKAIHFIVKNGIESIPICKTCKVNETRYISSSIGFREFCSTKCMNNSNDIKSKKKNICIERYGFDNPSKSDIVKSKISKNLSNQSIETIDKRKSTCLSKYGHVTNLQTDGVIEKRNLSISSVECIEKRKETCLVKYGVDSVNKSLIVRNKFKKTCDDKWGSGHFRSSDKFRYISNSRHIEKLNNEHISNNINIKIESLIDSTYKMVFSNCNSQFDISNNSYNIRKNKNLEICTICKSVQSNISLLETDLYNFIVSNYNGKIIRNYRLSKEVDIFLPDINIAFEFNGVYWHSDKFKDKRYHLNKSNEFNSKGIQIHHIWEDDWIYKQEIVKSMILSKINKTSRIFARKCDIREVSNKESTKFLKDNHIFGGCVSKYRYGLYYDNELVSIMTFGKLRVNLGQSTKDNEYELLRFCSKINTTIIGGASRLLKAFKNNINFSKLITYSSNDYSIGNLYSKIGFEFNSDTEPTYYWLIDGIRVNRWNFRKDKLVKLGYDKNLTGNEIMSNIGYKSNGSGNKKWVMYQ